MEAGVTSPFCSSCMIVNGVLDNKFYKGPPPPASNSYWIQSSKNIGYGGWSLFQFSEFFFNRYI